MSKCAIFDKKDKKREINLHGNKKSITFATDLGDRI